VTSRDHNATSAHTHSQGASYPAFAPFGSEVDSWTHDALGNRISATVNGSTQPYSYFKNGANPLNGQRLQTNGAVSLTYDPAGNTQTRTGAGGNFTFGYDVENRLASISGAAGTSYSYDYIGRRRTQSTAAGATSYSYGGHDLVSEVGSTTSYYLFGPGLDEPLAAYRNGVVTYFDIDGLGSVVAENGNTGSVVHSAVFDAWGGVRAETGTRVSPFGYTGREFGDAGLAFYRARYYEPRIGRFTQEDPSGPSQDLHLYRYVRNAPTVATDPTGLQLVRFPDRPYSWPVAGCDVTPWHEASVDQLDLGEHKSWRKAGELGPRLIRQQPGLRGQGAPNLGPCVCRWALVKMLHQYQKLYVFERQVMCPPCLARTEEKAVYDPFISEVPIPFIGTETAVTPGWYLNGSCQCSPPSDAYYGLLQGWD
jgi:RHS repeat-associated protein